jgi:hypothetical protein
MNTATTPDSPAQYPARDAPGTRRCTIALRTGAAVVVLGLLGTGIAALSGAFDSPPSDSAPTLTPQDAVATAFLERYARHDPAVCALATPQLRTTLQRGGRCNGTAAAGAAPVVEVLLSRTCGARHGFSAAVTPPGEIAAPYVTVGLELEGTTWSVRSVLPIADRGVIRDYACAPPTTRYGG